MYTVYAEIQRQHKNNTAVRGSQLYVERSNVQITQKKPKMSDPYYNFGSKSAAELRTFAHTQTQPHTTCSSESSPGNCRLEKELRDHFSTIKVFTKPKNTHSPNPSIQICPPRRENTLLSHISN